MSAKEGRLFKARQLSSALPPLLLAAERVAAVVHQGTHGRRRAGTGESFWQFRNYTAGDAAHLIDWRQSARTDRLFVREREWEAAQTTYIWADVSGSMHYRSGKEGDTKADRAQLLMLALADLLLRGGEKVSWLGEEVISGQGKAGLRRLAAHLMETGASHPPPIRIAKHAQIVLASDFLMPPEKFDELMRNYAALNLKGVLLHILDPAEQDLPFIGRVEMRGCEDETPLVLPNAASLRSAYQEKMRAHQAWLAHAAEAAGWYYTKHVTHASSAASLLQLYQYLSVDSYPFAQPFAQKLIARQAQ